MVAEPKIVPVPPQSELARVLEEATDADVFLVSAGRRFRIVRDESAEGDAANPRAWEALERSFGILKGIDAERLKAELREQRGQDTPGRPGW
jgi:hypothetical protein